MHAFEVHPGTGMARPKTISELAHTLECQAKAATDMIEQMEACTVQLEQVLADRNEIGLTMDGFEQVLAIKAQYRRAIASLDGSFTCDPEPKT